MSDTISTTEQPNRVADAASLLDKFIKRNDGFIVDKASNGDADDFGDDRAAVIAAQLLAIASEMERMMSVLERIAAVLEESHS